MAYDIDFVITWVDDSDPVWQCEFKKHKKFSQETSIDASAVRYRDYGLLKYWFRGVEQFAPWVRYIHFVTYGHIPEWLDTSNPKLKIVKHEDYIPKQYLPLFNSNPIELLMHKIPNLSEHFVYFNDDFYLTKAVSPDYFFHNGMPCDVAVISITEASGIMGGITKQNMSIINQNFHPFHSIIQKPWLWLRFTYGKCLLNTIRGILFHKFVNPGDPHAPLPYLKNTWEEVWSIAGSDLEKTLHHRFRSQNDNSHWLIRYWHIMKGEFVPRNILQTTKVFYETTDKLPIICESITKQNYSVVVINDNESISKADSQMVHIKSAFETILPHRSSFELLI